MRTRAPRTAAATLTLSALVLGLGGCGGSEDEPTAAEPTATATADDPSGSPEPAPAEAAAPEEGATVAPDALLERMKAAVGEETSARFTMTMLAAGQEVRASGALEYAESGNAMDIAMTLPGQGKVRLIAVDGEVYASVSGQNEPGTFLRIDPDDPSMGMLAGQIESMDPLRSFEAFDAGLEEVTHVGEEQVDGEALHHYRLVVDGRAAAEAQGQTAPGTLPATITYDLWLDDADQMRRVTFDLGQASAEMTMSDWGEPVDIAAPAPGMVTETP